jgi:sulfite oxidase
MILLGAGASVEPFWMLIAVHKKPEILSLLEKYRIGNLAKGQEKLAIMDMENPYANEPLRHPALKVRSQTLFNAEPPLELLVENYITPTEIFYVRTHLPVPDISEEDYSLEVVGSDDSKSFQLSLNDLKRKFSKHSLTATLQCAGNRHAEMNEVLNFSTFYSERR